MLLLSQHRGRVTGRARNKKCYRQEFEHREAVASIGKERMQKRILFVISMFFERGYDVDEAEDGAAAFAAFCVL